MDEKKTDEKDENQREASPFWMNLFLENRNELCVCVSQMSEKPTSQVIVWRQWRTSWSRSDSTFMFQPNRYFRGTSSSYIEWDTKLKNKRKQINALPNTLNRCKCLMWCTHNVYTR